MSKRDLDYRDDYELTSLSMGPLEDLSDNQSDSELSSSSNSQYSILSMSTLLSLGVLRGCVSDLASALFRWHV